MSPVTERIVKADTTSLLQQAHFLHPTQQMVQREAAIPFRGLVGSVLHLATVLEFISICTIVLVRYRVASKGGAENSKNKLICITVFTTVFHKVMRSRPARNQNVK